MTTEYTARDSVKILKVIYNLSQDDFHLMMEPDLHKTFPSIENSSVEIYLNGKFQDMKQDMYFWLCSLDYENQEKVFDYAAKKLMWTKLNKRKRV
jgi:hypothetical protein